MSSATLERSLSDKHRIRGSVRTCVDALLRAQKWAPVVTTAQGAKIYCELLAPESVTTFLWVQTFDDDEHNTVWNKLNEVLHGDAYVQHALAWDPQLVQAHILKHIQLDEPDLDVDMVYFATRTPPLRQKRDMLFLNAKHTSEDGSEVICVYQSISEEEAYSRYRVNLDEFRYSLGSSSYGSFRSKGNTHKPRVRAEVLLPSCDRISKLENGQIMVEHMMTLDIKGWLPRITRNRFLKKQEIAKVVRETELFRMHVLQQTREAEQASMTLGRTTAEQKHASQLRTLNSGGLGAHSG